MKYEQALSELSLITSKMESGQYDIDQLAEQLKRAQELITLCRAKLTQADQEIQAIIGEDTAQKPREKEPFR